jgi:hypothetical protein
MKHYDQILRTYAESGLRSATEWLSLGRQIEADAKARAETVHKGAPLALYSRGQTRRLPPR